MRIIITNPGRNLEERSVCYAQGPARGPVAVLTEELDQEILGFGAALTDSACVLINRLDEERKRAFMEEIFSPEKANFSVARLCVGASDYAEQVYNFAPVPDDWQMEHFDATHDDKDILPVVKLARKNNPDLFLFSSPWSPPGWMKTSHAMQGGWMREKYVETYALYYLRFLQHYLKNGVRINALTPQNETETDQSSRMPACLWHPDIEMKFAKVMRRLLDENEFTDVKIWLLDHNFIMWHHAAYEMDDPEVKAACAGVAWHPYEGHPEQVTVFRKLHPECENHWTEGDMVSAHAKPKGWNVARYANHGASFLSALENGCQSITLWNLVLDEEGYPNVGPFRCKGTVIIHRDLSAIRPADDFWALSHFSRYIQRGARRIVMDNSAVPANFKVGAFRNPDGSKVVVVANKEEFDCPLYLQVDGKLVETWILRESINTILL